MKLRRITSSNEFEFFSPLIETLLDIPFIEGGVKAGFPSPAEDFTELSIDLNNALIKNPSSTFYVKVNGDSMKDVGINDGDLLIVDRSLEPQDGKIAVCYIDGEFTLKRIKVEKNYCWLMPANDDYKPIKITEDNDFVVWGVVIHSIKSF